MSLSQIAKSITASPTLALNAKFAALRQKGEAVIHLGGGEPKSKAPMDAILPLKEHLDTREIRYTPAAGIPALKDAIIKYTENFYNRKVERGNVVAASGAKHALILALQAILNPKDEVIFPVPYWVSYPDMVKICGANPINAIPADGSYYPSIGDIEKKISEQTKAVIINSPNNPSGAVYSEKFISDIIQFCEKKDLYLIFDDIYHRLVFDGRKPINPYDYTKIFNDKSKLILVNGVSKSYAMTGFRIGWAVTNTQIIKAMTNIQGHQTSGPSVLLQKAAIGAINGEQSGVEELRKTLEKNRDIMMELLNSFEGVEVTKPDGTFYCFADFSAFEKDSNKLSNFLIDEAKVLTVPGAEFGMEGFLRLSYCGSVEDITEGIQRIKNVLLK
ncbi:MAG: pyridoxal phosphate-dependent aminotransferase [Ignavibacteria bacterium]|nr:pyridoxal phosphate-dependent aminotransferase [Ignavibacteria bacterium]MBT8382554.1 pyridoxal phosphate-dependent aminotransferase [Ignavibacteria bacterium]MBT8392509.1 pyridoxal phosphate-dependent aminotransferase [Ignavibacteria bacterium]